MKCSLINFIVFGIAVNSYTSQHLFLPQLPVGEYRVNFLGVLRCADLIQSNEKIQFNYYLNKTSANTTEIKGNFTNSIPIDDSFDIEINMAVKDSIGGWKENAHIFKTPKACSSIKSFFGDTFNRVLDGLGMYNISYCPFPAGFYRAPGLNTEDLISKFPKKFFYGTYKFRLQYSKNNVVYGCVIHILQLKRPWETD